jgi:hypothetical protein
MDGISWNNLNLDEQRIIAMLGAGISSVHALAIS